MASLPASSAAWSTPSPVAPAACVDDVGAAVDLAPGQLAAARRDRSRRAGVVPVMFWKTSTFGLTYFAPSS